jgi:hypothetical protein
MKHRTAILLVFLSSMLAACGVQRPLIPPREIPAFEEAQRKKREDIRKELEELKAIDARDAATTPPAPQAR